MRANDNAAAPGPAELEQAADWIDRLDELSEADRQALTAWLQASGANAAAFDRIRRTVLDPALLQAAARVRPETISEAPRPAPAVRRAPPAARRFGLLAASLVGVGVAVAVIGVRVGDRIPEPAIQFATAVGARSDYGLSDASVVHLNADSKVSVRFTRGVRDVTLQKGDAMFDVAKNPHRPFVVSAGTATVTAVGTSFEVDRLDDAVEVRVFEGVVRVAPPQGPAYLARKGEWMRLAADRLPVGGRFAPELDQTWRSDWLVADQMPLKYVVARLNRYSQDQIAVRDPAAGNLKVTGRFRLSRTADALAMLSALLDVDARRSGRSLDLAPRHPTRPAAPTPPAHPS